MISRRERQNDNADDEEEELKFPLTRKDVKTDVNSMDESMRPIISKKSVGERFEQELLSYASVLLFVSLLLHKVIICKYDKTTGQLNFLSITTYFWLPSIFMYDIFYALVVISLFRVASSWMIRKEYSKKYEDEPALPSSSSPSPQSPKSLKRWYLARKLLVIIYCINVIFAVILTSFEIKSVIAIGENMYWNMTYTVFQQWDDFKGLISDKTNEGVSIQAICFRQMFFTLFLTMLLRWISYKKRNNVPTWMGIQVAYDSQDVTYTLSSMIQQLKTRNWTIYFIIIYVFMANTMRPINPYQLFSRTPMLAIPHEIIMGMSDITDKSTFNTQMEKKNVCRGGNENNTTNVRNVNVALIMLETMRADMFPFDPTTEWAKEKIPETASLVTDTNNTVTPFYAEWVKKPTTFYVPHFRAAAGFTHKALWSIFCSAYSLPKQGTKEHIAKYYHECLPHVLENSGVGYRNHQFFKSITSTFDHQSELAANIGFEHMYGEKEYNDEFNRTKEWKDAHKANYFGHEDDVIIEPVFAWVDNQTSKGEPFFLSYLSGATHDPYGMPPKVSWTPQSFAKDSKINNFLNEVAYTDRFLSKVIGEFKKRSLMNETLFVIMGDHGGNFKNRNDKFTTLGQFTEEAFDIGVSFYSENEEIANILENVAKNNINEKNSYSSIDVVPTILDLLNVCDGENTTELLNGKYDNSIVDGRSMLHPSGKRLEFSVANPGNGMVLKDGSYVILLPGKREKFFKVKQLWDLDTDPKQENPIDLDGDNAHIDNEKQDLIHWGKQAEKFLRLVEADLMSVIKQGDPCNTKKCAIRLLNSLESLNQWEGYNNKKKILSSDFTMQEISIFLVFALLTSCWYLKFRGFSRKLRK